MSREFADVHDAHCCKRHGCKYMDDDCTVVSGLHAGIRCEICDDPQELEIERLTARAETAERELAVLRNRPCPYVHSSREGTHYCTLPHAAEKELAELRKRVAEAPRGMVRGFMLDPETQPGWLDKMGGKRVAILPLREGE